MTFQGVQVGRVVQAVFMVFLVSLGLSLLTSCLLVPFVSADMMERLSDLFATLNTSGPNQEQQIEQFQNDVDAFAQDYEGELTIYYAVQWTLVAAVTYIVAGRMARRAAAPAQAAGYGLLIGVGVLVSYGAFCVAMTIAPGGIKLLYLMLLVMAGYFGGRSAGGRLLPADVAAPQQLRPPRPYFGPSQPGVRPEIFYNMGVQGAAATKRASTSSARCNSIRATCSPGWSWRTWPIRRSRRGGTSNRRARWSRTIPASLRRSRSSGRRSPTKPPEASYRLPNRLIAARPRTNRALFAHSYQSSLCPPA